MNPTRRASAFTVIVGLVFFTVWLGTTDAWGATAPYAEHDRSGNLTTIGVAPSPQPRILSGPAPQTIAPGGSTSFAVTATGTGLLTYQWFRDNTALVSARGAVLYLPTTSTADLGTYHVVVQNGAGSVTSPAVRLEWDADHDGLGDAWELTYFDALTNQNRLTDRDGDGIADGEEFAQGTNPTNRNSFVPGLSVYGVGGSVQTKPDLASYRTGDVVELTAVPNPGNAFIGWVGDTTGTTNPVRLTLTGNRAVQANFGLPLAQAINTTNPVTIGGAGGWLGQTEVSQDGDGAAAVAPSFAGTGDPYLEVKVNLTLDGVAQFWWRVDGDASDQLQFLVDGNVEFSSQRSLSGVSPWLLKVVYLPAGEHRLRWEYRRHTLALTAVNGRPLPTGRAFVDGLKIVEFPNPLQDLDGNGLPDLWEYHYFDQLGVSPDADPDRDGVSTGTELADGTDPSKSYSVKPRITYRIQGQGTAVSSPAGNSVAYGQYVTNVATPDAGWKFVAWVGPFDTTAFIPSVVTNNPSRDLIYQAKVYTAIFGRPLADALETPALTWSTGGKSAWYGQELQHHDGVDAAQSGPLMGSEQESWLETTVTGPGTLSFWWKLDAAPTSDYLALRVNGSEALPRRSGRFDWEPVQLDLPAGAQTLRWLFRREYGYDTNALNTAWLDQVVFTSGPTAPRFVQLPTSLRGFAGSNLVFQVLAQGTPTIQYQVLRAGTTLTSLSTNRDIVVANATAALSGAWTVRAVNSVGTTDSSPIPVEILAAPSNDNVSKAVSLAATDLAKIGYTYGATTENNEPAHDSYHAQGTVWYVWHASESVGMRATVTGTNLNGRLTLGVYRSTGTNLREVTGATSYSQETNGIQLSQTVALWSTRANTDYYLVVDTGWEGAFFQLAVERVPRPANDAFADRLPLTGPYALVRDNNSLATAETGEPPVYSLPPFFRVAASNSLWWTWTAPVSGRAVVQAIDSTSPLLSVFTGEALSSLTLVTNSYAAGSRLEFPISEGTPYAISAGAGSSGPSEFAFIVSLPSPSLRVLAAPESVPLELLLQGLPNTELRLEFSPDLISWYVHSEARLASDGQERVTIAPEKRRLFYRAVTQ